MRLLILTQSVDRNDPNLGAFSLWFERLAQRFEQVTIVSLKGGEHRLPHHVTVLSAGKERGHGRFVRRILFAFFTLRGLLRSDAVFVHMIPEYALLVGPWALLFRKPVYLWYAHGATPLSLRLALPFVRSVFTSSVQGFRVASRKREVVGQAIDTTLFLPTQGDLHVRKKALITIGRISRAKHLERTLEVLANLEGWTLTIVGAPITTADASYERELHEKVRTLGIAERVTFLGPARYADIPALLQLHGTFLNFSSTGSLDKAVLEAMAAGLHVVVSNEAFKTVVPARCFIDASARVSDVAARVRENAERPLPEIELRDRVVAEHGIDATISRIASVIYEGR